MELPNSSNINWKPYLLRFVLPLAIVLLLVTLWVVIEPAESKDPYPWSVMERRTTFCYVGSFNRDFNDLNDLQLTAAKAIGIQPVQDRADAIKHRNMVEISTNPYYKVEDLTHSIPYLVPTAATLLEEIGRCFTETLVQDTLPLYRPIVTSVTRTLNDVHQLRKSNGNASLNSTHMYGTTVDISWKRFDKVHPEDPRAIPPEELKHLLANILKQYHREGRCYIKHERKQACFHITARR